MCIAGWKLQRLRLRGDDRGRHHNHSSGPRRGTPAAELTDRDKLALAIAAGVPVQTSMEGMQLTVKALRSIGVADRGDGGYIVATGPL